MHQQREAHIPPQRERVRHAAAAVFRPRPMDDSVPAMVWTARPDMSCDYLSREWLRFTGCSEDQALGDGWSRNVHPEDLARWLDICVRAFDAREPFEIEYRLRRSDGEYRWMLDRGVPRYSADGVFLGFAGTCVDIDECRRTERELARALERERSLRIAAEDAVRRRDGFLAGVLGDLRSPLQAIAAWAQHLRHELAQTSPGSLDGAAAALDSIERNAQMQERVLCDLLELSRIGRVEHSVSQPQKEQHVNWDRIEGNWKQLKGSLKTKWGKITDDELDQLAGHRDQLVGKIQERYGCARDEAEKQVKDWESQQ